MSNSIESSNQDEPANKKYFNNVVLSINETQDALEVEEETITLIADVEDDFDSFNKENSEILLKSEPLNVNFCNNDNYTNSVTCINNAESVEKMNNIGVNLNAG